MTTARKLESAEKALLELYDALEKDGEWAKSHDVVRYRRRISQWRNK